LASIRRQNSSTTQFVKDWQQPGAASKKSGVLSH
jgi:hypothetical protein